MSTRGAAGQTRALALQKACDALEDVHRGLVPGGSGQRPYRTEGERMKARPRCVRSGRARSISARHVRRQPIMPPRPRPKPKVRSGSGSQSLKETPPSRDEEDSIFIKSGNLTTATWKQMNQIPSGVFPYNRRSFASDIGPVRESYEEYDSENDEGARKTTKKRGGNAPIPERYPPKLLSDLIKYLTAHLQGQISFR